MRQCPDAMRSDAAAQADRMAEELIREEEATAAHKGKASKKKKKASAAAVQTAGIVERDEMDEMASSEMALSEAFISEQLDAAAVGNKKQDKSKQESAGVGAADSKPSAIREEADAALQIAVASRNLEHIVEALKQYCNHGSLECVAAARAQREIIRKRVKKERQQQKKLH